MEFTEDIWVQKSSFDICVTVSGIGLEKRRIAGEYITTPLKSGGLRPKSCVTLDCPNNCYIVLREELYNTKYAA